MSSIPDRYTRELHKKYKYLACWLPSTPLALGDVGLISQHRFRKVTTLDELGIPFTKDAESKIVDLDYSSADCVAVTAGTRVDDPAADVMTNLSITFDRGGATLFQASGCVQETIGNLLALQEALRERYANKTWRTEYVVVTEVVRTGPTAILVSEQHGAQMNLRVRAGSLGGPLAVVGALGNYSVTAKSGIAASVLAPDGATPLFQAVQLRRRLVGPPELVFRSDEDDDEDEEEYEGDHEGEAGLHEGPDEPVELELAPLSWTDCVPAQSGPLEDRTAP
ncbi:hypothetical protein [Streptomyces sp. NPDC006463]|uniref:hypothetical protein n=1 Tax=Streptomyces sp. NPDC006463 TaxID=3364746 RepID=UPI0036A70ADC